MDRTILQPEAITHRLDIARLLALQAGEVTRQHFQPDSAQLNASQTTHRSLSRTGKRNSYSAEKFKLISRKMPF